MYLYFTEELTPNEVSCSLNFLCSTSLLQNMQRMQTNIVGFFYYFFCCIYGFVSDSSFRSPKFLVFSFFDQVLLEIVPQTSRISSLSLSVSFFIVIFFIHGLCCFTFFPSVIICLSLLEDWTLLCLNSLLPTSTYLLLDS